MSTTTQALSRFTRRRLLGSSLAGAALVASVPVHHAVAQSVSAPLTWRQEATPSPTAARTWFLTSPDELRPADPGAPSQAEIAEVVAAQSEPTIETTAAIARWGSGPAVIAWSQLAEEVSTEFEIGGMYLRRFLATYHTALHDAAIAAWDAREALGRSSPGATSDAIIPAAGVDPARSSFPSEHAVVAGAAATVLAYLVPDAAAGRFDALAAEAAASRIAAGAAFRSDIDLGLALGQAIGERAVARARADGSDAEWDPATMPTGPGFWQPTPPDFVETPRYPMAGSWMPWVLASGDQVRPAPPPEYDSPVWQAELRMVQEVAANLSFEQERAAVWWGTANSAALVNGWAHELILKAGVGSPQAAQILADVHVASVDALIAVWDAKYTWWTARPVTADPTLVPLIPTSPYPSYPSGYSGVMGAGTTVIGHYFPEVADEMADRAWEAAASRCWAGVHYVIDDDAGLTMGRQVGRLVCALPGANPVDDA